MIPAPGPLNLITDVSGLGVGHAEGIDQLTGVTVLLPEQPAIAAIDQRGGAPGTRETDVLTLENTIDVIHALVFAGGSAFGLESATGVQRWLFEQDRGFPIGDTHVPIVPCAVIFDLFVNGDDSNHVACDYRAMGIAACEKVNRSFSLGNAGAGLGAIAGEVKGGTGSASLYDPRTGFTVGALVIVNSVGSAIIPGTQTLWAWPFEQQGELGQQPTPSLPNDLEPQFPHDFGPASNTTLVAVATDAPLSSSQVKRMAIMAQDGLARALRPVHAPQDGDTIFALSTTGAVHSGAPIKIEVLSRMGALGADCTTRAIARAVFEAESAGIAMSYRDRFGAAISNDI